LKKRKYSPRDGLDTPWAGEGMLVTRQCAKCGVRYVGKHDCMGDTYVNGFRGAPSEKAQPAPRPGRELTLEEIGAIEDYLKQRHGYGGAA